MRLFFYIISANKMRYPIDRTAKPVSTARGAGNQPVRRRMLSRSLRKRTGTCVATQLTVRRMPAYVPLVAPAEGAPRMIERWNPLEPYARWQSVCQRAHTHFCEGRTRMAKRQNLLEPYTPPKINFSGRKGSRMFRPPHKRAQYAVRGTIGEDAPAQSCKRCKAVTPQKARVLCGAIFRICKLAP